MILSVDRRGDSKANFMPLRKLQDLDVAKKVVLTRVDFNVPFDEEGNIKETHRLKAAWPTIDYLLEREAKVVLLAHLSGKIGFKKNAPLSLETIAKKASEVFGREIKFCPRLTGEEAKKHIAETGFGEILMLENLRTEAGEEKGDRELAENLAELGDVYINDGFGVCHRSHASVVILPELLPSAAGLLIQKEVAWLEKVLAKTADLVVVLGGAKISTKMKFINKFLEEAKEVIIGGALANNLLKLKGLTVGSSLVEANLKAEDVKNIELTSSKLHLPVDVAVGNNLETENRQLKAVGKIEADEIILDIGDETAKLFSDIIAKAQGVVWNGPMGFFENEKFFTGTKKIAEAIAANQNFSVVGGGETVLCLDRLGLLDRFSHVSTGGGAMMDFLSGDDLPGLRSLGYYD